MLHGTLTLARLWTVLELNFYAMDSGASCIVKPYYVFVRIKEASVKMVDTGTTVSLISESLYKCSFTSVKHSTTNCMLKTFSQESLKLKSKFKQR